MIDITIEMHDGKVFMNGHEYAPEEFAKIMPGIKVPQNSNWYSGRLFRRQVGSLQ